MHFGSESLVSPCRHYLTHVLSLNYMIFNKAMWWLVAILSSCKLRREAQDKKIKTLRGVSLHENELTTIQLSINGHIITKLPTFQVASYLFMLIPRAGHVCTIRSVPNATQHLNHHHLQVATCARRPNNLSSLFHCQWPQPFLPPRSQTYWFFSFLWILGQRLSPYNRVKRIKHMHRK